MKRLLSLFLCVLFLSLNASSGVDAKTLTPEKRIATFLNSLESNEEFTI